MRRDKKKLADETKRKVKSTTPTHLTSKKKNPNNTEAIDLYWHYTCACVQISPTKQKKKETHTQIILTIVKITEANASH